MAYATTVTIGAGRKVSVNYNSQEVNLTVCYQLERSDTDLLKFVQEKAAEVEQAHQTAWQRLRDQRAADKGDKPDAHNADIKSNSATTPEATEVPGATNVMATDSGVATARDASALDGDGIHPIPPSDGHSTNNGSIPSHNASGPPMTTAIAVDEAVAAEPREALSTKPQRRAIAALAERLELTGEDLENLIVTRFGRSTVEELTKRQAGMLLEELQRKARNHQQGNSRLETNDHYRTS